MKARPLNPNAPNMVHSRIASSSRGFWTRFLPVPCTCRFGLRYYSTPATSSLASSIVDEPVKANSKSDWKRRQEGSNFIDTLSVALFSGKGGAGGVSFHREKFMARGPPSGGSGGAGGSVYLVATPTVTSLSHLPTTLRAGQGGSGGGKWLAGKQGDDIYVRVPVGTVVREVRPRKNEAELVSDERQDLEWAWEVNRIRLDEAERRTRRWDYWKKGKDLAEKEGRDWEVFQEETEIEVDPGKAAAHERVRKDLFVIYPMTDLAGHPSFLLAEHQLLSKLLARKATIPGRKARRRRKRDTEFEEEAPPLYLDLTKPTPLSNPILLLAGGQPGLGNPSFQSAEDRSPKYATKGGDGEMMRLELEVKAGGEVGLVGMPNAGKSTLLRALTSSTPRVASYAFTTLNPHHGTCVLYSDQTFSGPRGTISDTTSLPEEFSADSPRISRRRASAISNDSGSAEEVEKRVEVMRFTITDNPGLVERSAQNVGLGHAFLRHLERCRALVYVVDLAGGTEPVEALRALEVELAEYDRIKGTELTSKVRGVIVNKADLFGERTTELPEEEEDEIARASAEDGKRKLLEVMEWVKSVESEEMKMGTRSEADTIWVTAVSAKRRENMRALVSKLADTVKSEREEEKEEEKREQERIELEREEALREPRSRW